MTRIFISSVQKEFAQERKDLFRYIREDALLRRFFQPFLFENLPAIDLAAQDAYLAEASQSEIYLGIYGEQYGYEDTEGISPTEREFEVATENKRHRLIFVKRGCVRHPKEDTFIKKVEAQLVRKGFSDFQELKTGVYDSLVRYLENEGSLRTMPWDATINIDASVEEIDPEKVRLFVELAKEKRNSPLTFEMGLPKILQHLGLMTDNGKLTNASLLLFGKRPQHFFISSEVKCAQFYGVTVQKPIPYYQIFKGGLFELVDQAVGFVMNHIDAAVGTRDKSNDVDVKFEIPVEAVAEAILNAVIHRSYLSNASVQVMLFRDRLEIWSPGCLPPEMSEDKILKIHKSHPVNPLLAQPAFLAGYIEKLGTGTLDLVERCRKAGLRTPEFHFDEDGKVIIWRKNVTPDVTPNVADNQGFTIGNVENVTPDVTPDKSIIRVKNILVDMLSNKYITSEQMAAKYKVSLRTIKRDLNSLRTTYSITWIPLSNKTGYWKIEEK